MTAETDLITELALVLESVAALPAEADSYQAVTAPGLARAAAILRDHRDMLAHPLFVPATCAVRGCCPACGRASA